MHTADNALVALNGGRDDHWWQFPWQSLPSANCNRGLPLPHQVQDERARLRTCIDDIVYCPGTSRCLHGKTCGGVTETACRVPRRTPLPALLGYLLRSATHPIPMMFQAERFQPPPSADLPGEPVRPGIRVVVGTALSPSAPPDALAPAHASLRLQVVEVRPDRIGIDGHTSKILVWWQYLTRCRY